MPSLGRKTPTFHWRNLHEIPPRHLFLLVKFEVCKNILHALRDCILVAFKSHVPVSSVEHLIQVSGSTPVSVSMQVPLFLEPNAGVPIKIDTPRMSVVLNHINVPSSIDGFNVRE
jgi:hypothetical protein